MITAIQRKVTDGLYELSGHALTRSIQRAISLDELTEAVGSGQIIAQYPDDRFGPSCLILGYTNSQRPLHIHCSYPSRPILKIVTLYEPTLDLWEADLKTRRL